MKILWMPEAIADLQTAYAYIAQNSPQNAQKVVVSIAYFVQHQLELFPESGKTGRVVNTLEIQVPRLPYCIPYRLHDGRIEILRVYHTKRQWPENFS